MVLCMSHPLESAADAATVVRDAAQVGKHVHSVTVGSVNVGSCIVKGRRNGHNKHQMNERHDLALVQTGISDTLAAEVTLQPVVHNC